MNNITKFKIAKPAKEIFESFVNPEKIKNFWFSSSSDRWEKGKTIILRYDEYNAELDIKVIDIDENKKIVFNWGPAEDEHTVTITMNELDDSNTIIEVNEEGFNENDHDLLHKMVDNKEGWVFVLTCLKGYLEFGVTELRGGIAK